MRKTYEIIFFCLGIVVITFGYSFLKVFSNPEIIFYVDSVYVFLSYLLLISFFSILLFLIEVNLTGVFKHIYDKIIVLGIFLFIFLQIFIFIQNYFFYPGSTFEKKVYIIIILFFIFYIFIFFLSITNHNFFHSFISLLSILLIVQLYFLFNSLSFFNYEFKNPLDTNQEKRNIYLIVLDNTAEKKFNEHYSNRINFVSEFINSSSNFKGAKSISNHTKLSFLGMLDKDFVDNTKKSNVKFSNLKLGNNYISSNYNINIFSNNKYICFKYNLNQNSCAYYDSYSIKELMLNIRHSFIMSVIPRYIKTVLKNNNNPIAIYEKNIVNKISQDTILEEKLINNLIDFIPKNKNQSNLIILHLKLPSILKTTQNKILNNDKNFNQLNISLDKLLYVLKSNDEYKKNLIILTSDHGEIYEYEDSELLKNFINKNIEYHDKMVNIPLYIKLPNQKNMNDVKLNINQNDIPKIIEYYSKEDSSEIYWPTFLDQKKNFEYIYVDKYSPKTSIKFHCINYISKKIYTYEPEKSC